MSFEYNATAQVVARSSRPYKLVSQVFTLPHDLRIKIICVCFNIHWWTFIVMSFLSQHGTKVF